MHPEMAVMRRFISTIIPAFVALITIGCGATSVNELTGPGAVRCQPGLAATPSSIPAAGGRVNVNVTAARECSWTARSDVSWVQLSPTSGQGDGAVTLTAEANQVPNSRTATVILNDQRLTLTQQAAPCRFTLSSTSARLDSNGGGTSVDIAAPAGCSWTAAVAEAWVHLSTTSGSGNATVSMTADRNLGSERSALATIAGQAFTVMQEAYTPPPPPPPPPPAPAPSPVPSPSPAPNPKPGPTPAPPPPVACSYAIDPHDREFGSDGGAGTISVTAPPGCTWSASSNAEWIAAFGAGAGNGTVGYGVDRFKDDGRRTGTISIAGQTFTVTQKGKKDKKD
jgi:hypothetical protein